MTAPLPRNAQPRPRRHRPRMREAIAKLEAAVHRLVDPVDAYRGTWLHSDSLYQQLSTAVVTGQQINTGTGGGSRSRPPMWTDAADMLNNIELMVSVWPTGGGTTTTALRRLAAKDWAPEKYRQVRDLAGIINAWCDEIEDLLNGRRSLHLVAACPACGESTVEVLDSAGELVRQPALQVVANRGCTCQACQHCWAPDRYLHLAETLGCERPAGVLE